MDLFWRVDKGEAKEINKKARQMAPQHKGTPQKHRNPHADGRVKKNRSHKPTHPKE